MRGGEKVSWEAGTEDLGHKEATKLGAWSSIEARQRILHRLRLELRRRHGGVRRAEARLGKSPGYLAKVARGAFRIPLEVFLEALEALGVEISSFFARALDAVSDPEDLLAELATLRPPRASERRFLAVAQRCGETPPEDLQNEVSTPLPEPSIQAVAEILRATPGQQRRRLKETRFHHPAVLLALLDHLDQRRKEPETVVPLATAVVLKAVPRLSGGARQVALRALEVVGSVHSLGGHLSSSARALALALELTEKESLAAGEILRRAVPLLIRAKMPRHARQLLRQALEIAVLHRDEALLEAVLRCRRKLFGSNGQP